MFCKHIDPHSCSRLRLELWTKPNELNCRTGRAEFSVSTTVDLHMSSYYIHAFRQALRPFLWIVFPLAEFHIQIVTPQVTSFCFCPAFWSFSQDMQYLDDGQLDNPYSGRVSGGNYTEVVTTKATRKLGAAGCHGLVKLPDGLPMTCWTQRLVCLN